MTASAARVHKPNSQEAWLNLGRLCRCLDIEPRVILGADSVPFKTREAVTHDSSSGPCAHRHFTAELVWVHWVSPSEKGTGSSSRETYRR